MKFASIAILALIGFAGIVVIQKVYNKNQCEIVKVITPSGQIIVAETARTGSEQRQGLSNRQTVAPGTGMLFLFDRKDSYTFWMKDTLIPLDIIWLDQQRVVDIKKLTPPNESEVSQHTPLASADTVLEIPAGDTARYQIKVGSQLNWNDSCSRQQ